MNIPELSPQNIISLQRRRVPPDGTITATLLFGGKRQISGNERVGRITCHANLVAGGGGGA